MRATLFFLLTVFCFSNTFGGTRFFATKKDLKSEWRIFQNDHYEVIADQQDDVNTIYFFIDADKYAGDYLHVVKDDQQYSIFINGQLASVGGCWFNIDSLSRSYNTARLTVAVHVEDAGVKTLQTSVETPLRQAAHADQMNERPVTFFRDFVIVATLILLIILIVVLRLNPKLASDYFSVTKIFSLRESDDVQIYTRISNSANILFYSFSSLILGFYLIVIFHFAHTNHWLSSYFVTTGFFNTLSKWIGVSVFIFVIFILKIILVYSSSFLFGSRTMAGIHFFNWVRLQLVVFGSISIILFIYFIVRGQNPTVYFVLLQFMTWCLVGWTIIIFLKLNGRTGYSLFQLFSYICATEIIPLIAIISVLYN